MDLSRTAPRTGPAPADWVPVDACTLPTSQQPLRVAEFDDLFAAALRAVERPPGTATRARLLLAGDEGLPERVQRLADAETACCSFFTSTVTPLHGDAAASVALDLEVPAAHADVLTALVARAEQARGAAA
ncbi:hypothetical protein ACU610_23775 [Geodermatophilus sp. URMC 61]|uniref:hypothetical protein n=1 Tax=Geodermatophilus sp. URMC 61 TaxID=3423411 RepID=UPI00406BFA3A